MEDVVIPSAEARTKGFAAKKAREAKVTKYSKLIADYNEANHQRPAVSYTFVPIAMETSGRPDDAALEFYEKIARRQEVVQKIPKAGMLSVILKTISVSFQRSMANNIIRRLVALKAPVSRTTAHDLAFLFDIVADEMQSPMLELSQ